MDTHASKPRFVLWCGLLFYAGSTLISMATMNLGFFVLCLTLLWEGGRDRTFWAQAFAGGVRPVLRRYWIASGFLSVTLLMSLIWAKWSPYRPDWNHTFSIGANIAKLWHLLIPIGVLVALKKLSISQLKSFQNVYFYLFMLLSLIGALQFFWGWPRPQPIPEFMGRYHATGFLGHHLSFASIWIFPFLGVNFNAFPTRFLIIVMKLPLST